MTKKRVFILAAVALILGALVYLQFRTWQKFDWQTFGHVTRGVTQGRGLFNIISAVLVIYCTYILRALRWKIFLRPVCKARFTSMIGPQFIGFTGLALLGRLGEFIRPYLVAKKENLTFSSQLGVLAVERIFDIGAFAVLMATDVFVFASSMALPPGAAIELKVFSLKVTVGIIPLLRSFGALLLLGVGLMSWLAFRARKNPKSVAEWVLRKLSRFSQRFAHAVSHKVQAFGEGLNTIHDRTSFAQLVASSLAIWLLIAFAYTLVLHAYHTPSQGSSRSESQVASMAAQDANPVQPGPERVSLEHMQVRDVVLLMGGSMLGSVIQLPAVGGGSQLATIGLMSSDKIFGIRQETAVSAGIMLWLVTFAACIPVGLVYAHFEKVSLRKITEESQHEEEVSEKALDR